MLRLKCNLFLVAFFTLAIAVFPALAEVALAPIFGSQMVLQRNMDIPVWGTAAPGEEVSVSIAGKSLRTQAGENGAWKVVLPRLRKSGPYTMTVQGAVNTITLEDVLAGEVWIASGQSNMQWPVKLSNNPEAEISAANHPEMRLFTVPRTIAETPQSTCGGEWVVCSPDTVPDFSAVAYFFGRTLHQELGVPVGMIHSSWGGTPAESWTSQSMLESDPAFASILERYADAVARLPEAMEDYAVKVKEWETAAEAAKAEGKPQPGGRPGIPLGPEHPHRPSGLYNAMIAPLAPYAIRGAIWYQGESNADRAAQYRKLFPAMITDWRNLWDQGDFSFYYVQLANFMQRQDDPQESRWAELREAQTMTLELTNTGMAIAIDIGEADDIHPRNKQDVGKRLAFNALAKDYKKKTAYSGPVYERMQVRGNTAILRFKPMGGALTTSDGGALTGFSVAGEDGRFVWAKAEIKGRTVHVSSPEVSKPVAVRYAWADNPACNLANTAGLPASPFRTDAPACD